MREKFVTDKKIEKIAMPGETYGIGADIVNNVVSGAVGGVAGAVASQAMGKIKSGKKEK